VLTLYLGALLLVALWVGWDSWTARRRMMRRQAVRGAWYRWPVGAVLGTAITVVGWEATEGGWLSKLPAAIKQRIEGQHAALFSTEVEEDLFKLDETALLYSADLVGAELVQIPQGWMGWDRAWREYRREHSDTHAREKQEMSEIPDLQAEFDEQRFEQRTVLNVNNLLARDLRKADASGAFLVGANFKDSRVKGVKFFRARMEGSNFVNVYFVEVSLVEARLEESNLSRAVFSNVVAVGARFSKSLLKNINIKFSDFNRSEITSVNMSNSIIRESSFNEANLDRSYLFDIDVVASEFRDASLQESDLGSSVFIDVDFRLARLNEADLWSARFHSVDFRGASFDLADLSSVKLNFSNISGVDLSKVRNLSQASIDKAFGDYRTKLPMDLVVPAHWPTKKMDVVKTQIEYCIWLESEGQISRFCPKNDE